MSLASWLLCQEMGETLTALLLVGVAQVDHLDTFEAQLQLLGHLGNDLVVAQQNGLADTLGLGLYGSFQHGGVNGLGKDYTLWMSSSGGVELLGELGLLTQQDTQRTLVSIPVVNRLSGHTALDGCLGNGCRHLGDKTWVNRFGNEVVAAEMQVVHLVDVVHHIGNGQLCQVGNGMNGRQLHLFVDG